MPLIEFRGGRADGRLEQVETLPPDFRLPLAPPPTLSRHQTWPPEPIQLRCLVYVRTKAGSDQFRIYVYDREEDL